MYGICVCAYVRACGTHIHGSDDLRNIIWNTINVSDCYGIVSLALSEDRFPIRFYA